MPVGEVVVTAIIPMPLDEAFAALTDDIDRWWRRAPGDDPDAIVRFDRDRLVAVSGDGAEVLAAVRAWDPPVRVDLDWRGPHAQPGDTVVIQLEPEADGTRVSIRHRRAGISPSETAAAIVGLWWGDVLQRLVLGGRS